MARKSRKIKTTRHRAKARPRTDKFIVGMVTHKTNEPLLTMFTQPQVHDSYAAALKDAADRYERYPGCKFVVFGKLATIGAPRLAPKIEEYVW